MFLFIWELLLSYVDDAKDNNKDDDLQSVNGDNLDDAKKGGHVDCIRYRKGWTTIWDDDYSWKWLSWSFDDDEDNGDDDYDDDDGDVGVRDDVADDVDEDDDDNDPAQEAWVMWKGLQSTNWWPGRFWKERFGHENGTIVMMMMMMMMPMNGNVIEADDIMMKMMMMTWG